MLPLPLPLTMPLPVLPIKHRSLKENWQRWSGNTWAVWCFPFVSVQYEIIGGKVWKVKSRIDNKPLKIFEPIISISCIINFWGRYNLRAKVLFLPNCTSFILSYSKIVFLLFLSMLQLLFQIFFPTIYFVEEILNLISKLSLFCRKIFLKCRFLKKDTFWYFILWLSQLG